tara:strand:+ start:1907 stop:3853 length:1947 start_codon:yes stop_codon:yes gene_type:complete
MIKDNIKNLFSFIEFLHSNIDNYKQYDNIIYELYLLKNLRKKLNPEKNYKDKIKDDKLKNELQIKFNIIHDKIIKEIESKAISLNISDDNEFLNIKNFNLSEINNLKKTFDEDDIPIILDYNKKYMEFRTETNCTYFQDLFFYDLDRVLDSLFSFFNDSSENQFDALKNKDREVKSIGEAVHLLQRGFKNFTLPLDALNPTKDTEKKVKEEPQLAEHNIYDKIIKELDLIEHLFYTQTYPYSIEEIKWNQHQIGRYCNEIYINSDINLFEITLYKNHYTNRIENNNSNLLKNELTTIYKRAIQVYNYFIKELKDHKDKKEIYSGKDLKKQVIENTVLFGINQFKINIAFFDCNIEEEFFKSVTKSGITKQCKNETLINFCVQLLSFIDLSGVIKPQPKQLKDFINENKAEALSLNLSDYTVINNVLQKQKDKLRDAEFESEFLEVKEFAEKIIKQLKHKLQLELRNNYGKVTYKNGVAPYLWDIRLLLEYRELLKTLQTSTKQIQTNQPKTEITKERLLNKQNKLIPKVSIKEVYDFFKVLIDNPNRKGEFYLSEQKLLIFIKATFIDEIPIKQKFDVAFSKDKIDVRSVFKKFQDYCYDVEYNKTYVKDKYFRLMFEAFEGFSQKIDFNKWHKTNNKLPTLKRQKAK